MAKERDVLTPSQKIDVGILIRANMRRVGTAIDPQTERGYWVYINDYTDERIANEVGCNVAGVHHIRLSDRGKYPPASLKEAEQRIEDTLVLQFRYAALEKWCTVMHDKYMRLLQELVQAGALKDVRAVVAPSPTDVAMAPSTQAPSLF